MKKINVTLPDRTFRKLMKLKAQDQDFGDKDWATWFKYITRNVSLIEGFNEAVTRGTRQGLGEMWMENFVLNIPEIVDLDNYPEEKKKSSIGNLPKHEGEPALVVAAGPSISEHNHIELLGKKGFKGQIFATDRMLIPLLEEGVIPEYVVSVDGHREKILKWFDNPIVDEYAPEITGLFTSTSAPNAVKRFKDAGGSVHWFHGMLDNFYELDSVTGFLNLMTGSTALSCGGNVGSTCAIIGFYLKCTPIIFIGLDFGYTQKVPIEETAYWESLHTSGASLPEMQTFFIEGVNPDFGNRYYTDMVFAHYKEALLEMIASARVEVINATEGGCVFGDEIKGMKFADVLEQYGANKK